MPAGKTVTPLPITVAAKVAVDCWVGHIREFATTSSPRTWGWTEVYALLRLVRTAVPMHVGVNRVVAALS